WADMLEEERKHFEEEDIEEGYMDDELSLTHPAIDTNAKWDLLAVLVVLGHIFI
ncbi:18656_t:CDS:2, partial [Dentiscutata erythropus]